MQINSFYPVFITDLVDEASAFYVENFGFQVTFEADWYVSLRRSGPPASEIAFVDSTHPTVPEAYRRTVAGLLINIEVDDVDAQWQRLVVDGGLTPVLDIRSEEFGQRHFIVPDPAGVLVDIITEIPPAPAFAEAFSGQ